MLNFHLVILPKTVVCYDPLYLIYKIFLTFMRGEEVVLAMDFVYQYLLVENWKAKSQKYNFLRKKILKIC